MISGDHCTWSTVLTPLGDDEHHSSGMFSSFEACTPSELYKSEHQFSQKYQNVDLNCIDQQNISKSDVSSDNKDISQSYLNVFRDFQADTPTQHVEHDAFKKYDSFGRWMNEDMKADLESMLPFSSDMTCWASALDEDDPALIQQMQVDTRSKSVSEDKCFTISDVLPSNNSTTHGSKVRNTYLLLLHSGSYIVNLMYQSVNLVTTNLESAC